MPFRETKYDGIQINLRSVARWGRVRRFFADCKSPDSFHVYFLIFVSHLDGSSTVQAGVLNRLPWSVFLLTGCLQKRIQFVYFKFSFSREWMRRTYSSISSVACSFCQRFIMMKGISMGDCVKVEAGFIRCHA